MPKRPYIGTYGKQHFKPDLEIQEMDNLIHAFWGRETERMFPIPFWKFKKMYEKGKLPAVMIKNADNIERMDVNIIEHSKGVENLKKHESCVIYSVPRELFDADFHRDTANQILFARIYEHTVHYADTQEDVTYKGVFLHTTNQITLKSGKAYGTGSAGAGIKLPPREG